MIKNVVLYVGTVACTSLTFISVHRYDYVRVGYEAMSMVTLCIFEFGTYIHTYIARIIHILTSDSLKTSLTPPAPKKSSRAQPHGAPAALQSGRCYWSGSCSVNVRVRAVRGNTIHM